MYQKIIGEQRFGSSDASKRRVFEERRYESSQQHSPPRSAVSGKRCDAAKTAEQVRLGVL